MNVIELLVQIVSIKSSWALYTPTVSTSSGALTTYSASGRYLLVGKTLYVSIIVSITNNGTGAGSINVSLPASSIVASSQIIAGKETQTTGNALTGQCAAGGSTINVVTYNNAYPGGTNYTIAVSGVIEVQ